MFHLRPHGIDSAGLAGSARGARGRPIDQPDPFLTIIIPAYNEEARLPDTLPRVIDFAESQDYGVEVVVVDNASSDGTADIVRAAARSHPAVRLLAQPIRGKGAAVRMGMLSSAGKYRFICDADLAMPIGQLVRFVPPIGDRYDVAIASREVAGARRFHEPRHRHIMGRVFNTVVRVLAVPGIQDTQCGFKCFTDTAAQDIFSCQVIDGWAFDVEILHIAQMRGYRIVEVPIDWYYGEGSRVQPLRDSWRMVQEVFRVRRNGKRGLYAR